MTFRGKLFRPKVNESGPLKVVSIFIALSHCPILVTIHLQRLINFKIIMFSTFIENDKGDLGFV